LACAPLCSSGDPPEKEKECRALADNVVVLNVIVVIIQLSL
jgi:hypothetical protein